MIIDVHSHMTDKFFSDKIESVLEKCKKNGVETIISAGLNPEDNRAVLALSKKFQLIKASLGFYPLDVEKYSIEDIDLEIEFIKKQRNKIIAISEVGLDFLYGSDKKKQINTFEKFISLSESTQKPLIIHSRKAEKEVLEILESSNVKKIVLHSFSGNKKLIQKAIDKKIYFSIPPVVVRASNYQTLVELSPLNLLLTESDAPYQSPYKNENNFPYYIDESIKKISEIKKLDFLETKNILMMNFQNFSKKWKSI